MDAAGGDICGREREAELCLECGRGGCFVPLGSRVMRVGVCVCVCDVGEDDGSGA